MLFENWLQRAKVLKNVSCFSLDRCIAWHGGIGLGSVCAAARSFTGGCSFSMPDARSHFHSFPISLHRSVVVNDVAPDNQAQIYSRILRSHPAGQKRESSDSEAAGLEVHQNIS